MFGGSSIRAGAAITAVVAIVLGSGCHLVLDPARHETGEDAGTNPVRDGGPDAGADGGRDAGPPDAGPPPTPCEEELDCGPTGIARCDRIDNVCVQCPLPRADYDQAVAGDALLFGGALLAPLAIALAGDEVYFATAHRADGAPPEAATGIVAVGPRLPTFDGSDTAFSILTDLWDPAPMPAGLAMRTLDDGRPHLAALHADAAALDTGPIPRLDAGTVAPTTVPLDDRAGHAPTGPVAIVGGGAADHAVAWIEASTGGARLAWWTPSGGVTDGVAVGDEGWLDGTAGDWAVAPGATEAEVVLFSPRTEASLAWSTPGRTTRAQIAHRGADRYLLAWVELDTGVVQALTCDDGACTADGDAHRFATIANLRLPALVATPSGAMLFAESTARRDGPVVGLYFDAALEPLFVSGSRLPDGTQEIAEVTELRDLTATFEPMGAEALVGVLSGLFGDSFDFFRVGGCR